MQKLAQVCIDRPVFATMLVMLMVVAGAVGFSKLPVDRYPAVDLPTVTIRTVLPGASPEEVEVTVSQPIEEAVNTVEGITELRSISGPGSSLVLATFTLERDVDLAAQDVRDRLSQALRELPRDAEPPVVGKFDNDSSPALTIAVAGDRPSSQWGRRYEFPCHRLGVGSDRARAYDASHSIGAAQTRRSCRSA